jgi:hypothetical protein
LRDTYIILYYISKRARALQRETQLVV